MWYSRYAKEPFDLKLFMLRCINKLQWILLCAFIGALLIGGTYYLKNVTFGGRIPYEVTKKLDVEYAINPDAGMEYSYYVAYTWNDWVKSDVFMEGLPETLLDSMTKEEMVGYYEMTLPADTRHPYLIVSHPDKETAGKLSEALEERIFAFAQDQKEIETITTIDTSGPAPKVRDIRTLRAVILGAVIGTFFALFAIAFRLILDEGIFLPETFNYRYDIPVIGYQDQDGQYSGEVKTGIEYLFREKKRIGITAVEADLDLNASKALFADQETDVSTVCLPSVLQVPESVKYLRDTDGNLLLVQAGTGNGKAIEAVLYLCKMHQVKITAVLLVGADKRLIQRYRGE